MAQAWSRGQLEVGEMSHGGVQIVFLITAKGLGFTSSGKPVESSDIGMMNSDWPFGEIPLASVEWIDYPCAQGTAH